MAKEYPNITQEKTIFYVIGCIKCGRSGWIIASIENKKKTIAKCMHCGHAIEIEIKGDIKG